MTRGVVTLTSDFGLRDPFVAVLKGQILRRAPDAVIVDVTHDIAAHRPEEAGFWLARIPPYFPDGTVHLAIVDPGVGTARDFLVVACRRQLFLAPDNGLLAELAAREVVDARRVAPAVFETIGARAVGPTFHGRDLFGPLAAELATGRLPVEGLGTERVALRGPLPAPVARHADGLAGMVVTVDHFGNLLCNIEAAQLAGDWQAMVAGRALRRVHTYGDAATGELVALVNAWGLLEIAETSGSAAATLGVGRGEPVQVRFHPAG